MPDMIDFAALMDGNNEVQQLVQLVETIMNIPDDSLDETTVESLQGMIAGAITPRMRNESVRAMHDSFVDQEYTRAQAIALITTAKKEMNDFVEALNPSKEKRDLLLGLFNMLYSIFDEAVEKYHNYNIDLPMTLEEGAREPSYAHDTDAAADLYAADDMILPAHSQSNMVRTGVHIQLPEGWAALVLPRSSMGLKTGLRLSNSVGLIDADYRGPIGVIYDNISDSDYTIHAGDRIAQLLVVPSYRFKGKVVEELTETERGEGGFGSSGT